MLALPFVFLFFFREMSFFLNFLKGVSVGVSRRNVVTGSKISIKFTEVEYLVAKRQQLGLGFEGILGRDRIGDYCARMVSPSRTRLFQRRRAPPRTAGVIFAGP